MGCSKVKVKLEGEANCSMDGAVRVSSADEFDEVLLHKEKGRGTRRKSVSERRRGEQQVVVGQGQCAKKSGKQRNRARAKQPERSGDAAAKEAGGETW